MVTGGCGGIGYAISEALARAGARVLVADISEGLGSAVERLREVRRDCEGFRCDLMATDELDSLYGRIEQQAGRIDILVNSAGINLRGRADELDYETWREVMTLNLDVPFLLSKAWARRRISAGEPGSIVMLASLTSEQSRPSISAYASSKGGVRQLVKSLAVDWAQFGIRVNGIAPGYIATEMNRALEEDKDFTAWVIESTPMGRWGKPADIGPVATFLSSDAAEFITGQIIFVDGGWMAAL